MVAKAGLMLHKKTLRDSLVPPVSLMHKGLIVTSTALSVHKNPQQSGVSPSHEYVLLTNRPHLHLIYDTKVMQ